MINKICSQMVPPLELSAEGMTATEIAEQVRLRTGDVVRNLRVEILESGIVMTGTCGSFYGKQLAQSVAMSLLPDHQLDNHIQVASMDKH